MPIFSIITICYNSGSTIERTIKSVLSQTFKDYEYIIVDGGSKDSTLDIVRKYEPLFEGRMKWNSEPDKGIYNAMNKGIKYSNGKIIGIVNSDDWLEFDALQNVYETYSSQESPEESLICGAIKFHFIDNTVKLLKPNLMLFKKYAPLYEMAGIRHPAVFVPMELYQKYGVFDESVKVMADADLILRFYNGGVKFVPINKVLSNMSDGGLSNSRVLKIRYKDKCTMLRKNRVTFVKRIYILIEWLLRQIVKEIIPYNMLKKIRR